jgi:Flp pilus assembly protein TadD
MKNMKRAVVLIITAAVLATVGCKPKPADISPLSRKQAVNLVSEAQFAISLRDYARAEPLFAEAAKLCPDDGEYWLGLGVTRRRMDNKAGAKEAYEKARSAFRDAYKLDPKLTEAVLEEMYVLALLGRLEDAAAVLEKARKKDPADARLRMFDESKQLEQMITEPNFKELAL